MNAPNEYGKASKSCALLAGASLLALASATWAADRADPPLRRMTAADADEFAWHNGRRLPILRPQNVTTLNVVSDRIRFSRRAVITPLASESMNPEDVVLFNREHFEGPTIGEWATFDDSRYAPTAHTSNLHRRQSDGERYSGIVTLYNEASVYDLSLSVDYGQAYDLERSKGDTPYAITYIRSAGGSTGCDLSLVGTDIYHLIEFYDVEATGTAGDLVPVHRRYLGGVLANLGPYTGTGEPQFVHYDLLAPYGRYFASTGDDDRVYVMFRLGLVVNGLFVAEPTDAWNYGDCGPPYSSPQKICNMILAVASDK